MNEITITINPNAINPEVGATNVSSAIAWAAEQLKRAEDAFYDEAEPRLEKAIEAWGTAEAPTVEVEAEYNAAWTAHNKAEAVIKEYKNLYTTLCKLETDLLHLAWAMDDNNY